MAASSFGASGLKVSRLNLGSVGPKLCFSKPFSGSQIRFPRCIQFDGLEMSASPNRAFVGCQNAASDENSNISPEDTRSSSSEANLIPKPFQVESLVSDICDTTSIAEFEVNLGGFRLYVLRDLTPKETPLPPPVIDVKSVDSVDPPVPPIEVPNDNGSASSTSLLINRPKSLPTAVDNLIANAADNGLAIVQSPRVGYFRRSRTIKGKRAPPSCKEKQEVKEGQVVCYIEQLGGEIPVETEVSGEVIRILRKDGEHVGYGDALIAILPSFPGIKKL